MVDIKGDGGHVLGLPSIGQGGPDLAPLQRDAGAQVVDEHAVLAQGEVRAGRIGPYVLAADADDVVQLWIVAFAQLRLRANVYPLHCVIGIREGVLHLRIVQLRPVDVAVLRGIIEDLIALCVVLGQVLNGDGPGILVITRIFLVRRPAVVLVDEARAVLRIGTIRRPGVDVEEDIRADAGLIGISIRPLLVPLHILRADERVGDLHSVRIALVLSCNYVFALVVAAGIPVPEVLEGVFFAGGRVRIGIIGQTVRHVTVRHVAVPVQFHHDLLHGIAHGRAMEVVLGQVEEVVFGFPLHSLVPRDGLDGLAGPLFARIIANVHDLVAEGDGVVLVVDYVVVVLRHEIRVELQVQGEGQVVFRQRIHEELRLGIVAVHPGLGDREVDDAQAAVRDGEHVLVPGKRGHGVRGLVEVVRAFKLDGGVILRVLGLQHRLLRVVIIRGGCLWIAGVHIDLLQGNIFAPHFGFEDVDLFRFMLADADDLVPHGVFAKGDGGNLLVILLQEHADGDFLAVDDVAVVDPCLAHDDGVAVPRAVVDGGDVVAVLIALRVLHHHGPGTVLVVVLRQHILDGAAVLVVLGQALHGDVPGIRLPVIVEVAFRVFNLDVARVPRAVHLNPLEEVHALFALDNLDGEGELADALGRVLVVIFLILRLSLRIAVPPVLVNGVVDFIVERVGDDGVVVVLGVLIGEGFVPHTARLAAQVALRKGKTALAGFLIQRKPAVGAILPDRRLHPAELQLAAEGTETIHGEILGHGKVLRVEALDRLGEGGDAVLFVVRLPLLLCRSAVLFQGAVFQRQYDSDVLQLGLEGGSLPGLGHARVRLPDAAVAQRSGIIEIGIVLVAGDVVPGQDVVGGLAVLLHNPEDLRILGIARIILEILAQNIDVAIALGVVLGEGVFRIPGQRRDLLLCKNRFQRVRAVFVWLLALCKGDDLAVDPHWGGIAVPLRVVLVVAVAPQLIGRGGALFRVAPVKPDLVGGVVRFAGERQLDRAARPKLGGIAAMVRRGRVVVLDLEVVIFLQFRGNDVLRALCRRGGFLAGVHRIVDGGAVQLIFPGVVNGEDAVGRTRAGLRVLEVNPRAELAVALLVQFFQCVALVQRTGAAAAGDMQGIRFKQRFFQRRVVALRAIIAPVHLHVERHIRAQDIIPAKLPILRNAVRNASAGHHIVQILFIQLKEGVLLVNLQFAANARADAPRNVIGPLFPKLILTGDLRGQVVKARKGQHAAPLVVIGIHVGIKRLQTGIAVLIVVPRVLIEHAEVSQVLLRDLAEAKALAGDCIAILVGHRYLELQGGKAC